MKQRANYRSELFWPRVVVRKLLNFSAKESDFSADSDLEDDNDSDSETEELCTQERRSRFGVIREDDVPVDSDDTIPRCRRRRNSETFRAQYINKKELRISVGTWNVGGKVPPDDLDIDNWIDMKEPADIYVFGMFYISNFTSGQG